MRLRFAPWIILLICVSLSAFAQDTALSKQKSSASRSKKTQSKKSINKNRSSKKFRFKRIKSSRVPIDPKKVIHVKYNLNEWNTSSTEIDNGTVLLRDARTKKILQLTVEETAPDSGVFEGIFSIHWEGKRKIIPEVYTFKDKKEFSDSELREIKRKIDARKIKRRPLVYRRSETGNQVLEVFDSRRAARKAMTLVRRNQLIRAKKLTSAISIESEAANAVYKADEIASFVKERQEQELANEKSRIERLRLQQNEIRRIKELRKKQSFLSKEEKQSREEKAVSVAESALDLYRVGKYQEAEVFFKKSIEFDPKDTTYLLQYGITLYKNKKYNEAIATFKIVRYKGRKEIEKRYYLALSHYRMNEYDQALKNFEWVAKNKDDKLSPLAYFYKGIVNFKLKEYEKSKPNFQKVLDTSKNPRLDTQAERYIDEINKLLAYAKKYSDKFVFTGSLGTQYDSNVLQEANQSSPTGSASPRMLLGLDLLWRPIYSRQHEFGLELGTDYIYTTKTELDDYDSWSTIASMPYTFKGLLFDKPYQFGFTPGYEILYFGQDTSGAPDKLLTGLVFELSNTFVMKKTWYLSADIEVRLDDYVSDKNTQDATKSALQITNVFYLDQDQTHGIITETSYRMNSADGADYTNNRIELGVLYTAQTHWWGLQFTGGVNWYLLNYPDKSNNQKDTNLKGTLLFSKNLSDHWAATLLSQYIINSSNVSSYEYDKYNAGLFFSYKTTF